MINVKKYYILLLVLAALTVSAAGQQALSASEQAAVEDFGKRVKAYSEMRERIEAKLPKLLAKATPEQIEAHTETFQRLVQAARQNSAQGDVITPAAADAIRKMIGTAYVGEDRERLRKTVFEAENKNVPLRINYPYPEAEEILEVPPQLLLALPQLPKQVRYRFVGGSLLLMDRENYLIVDYMTNAIP